MAYFRIIGGFFLDILTIGIWSRLEINFMVVRLFPSTASVEIFLCRVVHTEPLGIQLCSSRFLAMETPLVVLQGISSVVIFLPVSSLGDSVLPVFPLSLCGSKKSC